MWWLLQVLGHEKWSSELKAAAAATAEKRGEKKGNKTSERK